MFNPTVWQTTPVESLLVVDVCLKYLFYFLCFSFVRLSFFGSDLLSFPFFSVPFQREHAEAASAKGPLHAHDVSRVPEADPQRVRLRHRSRQGHAEEQPAHRPARRGKN